MWRRILLCLIVFCLIILIDILFHEEVRVVERSSSFSHGLTKKEMKAKSEWEAFKKTQEGLSSAAQHQNAHKFGSTLYKSIGLDGINICDQSFNSGCYHSLVGEAIAEHGVNIVYQIDRRCKKRCDHGIGHGLLGATEYNLTGLKESLEICKRLGYRKLTGCLNGVFMEFNFKTLHNGISDLREFDAANLFYPCNDLPDEFSNSCYFAQSQWWRRSLLEKTLELKYAKIGTLCLKLVAENRKSCALGAGSVLPVATNNNIEKMISLCKELDSYELEAYCRVGIAGLRTEDLGDITIHRICSDLKASDRDYCTNFNYLN